MVRNLFHKKALAASVSCENRGALLQVFERRKASLSRLMAGRVGANEGGEDLLQDLFIKIYTTEHHEPILDADAFCFRLAYNLAADHCRSAARSRRREDRWGVETGTFIGAACVLPEPSADEALASRQQLTAVLAAVERLPPRSREVFRLHKLDGLSYAETAKHLALSVSAVEKHMMRALAAIARVVKR